MPQMLFWRPLKKLDCCDETRLQPPALFHILCGQPFTPPSLFAFGQVPEGQVARSRPRKRWNNAALEAGTNPFLTLAA
jgi:hypothetical protein